MIEEQTDAIINWKIFDWSLLMQKLMMMLFIPAFLLIIYIIGTFLNKLLRAQAGFIQKLMYGFIIILALFQVVATPFMLLKTDFNPLYFTFLGILIVFFGAGLFFCRCEIRTDFIIIVKYIRRINIETIIVFSLILLQVIAVTLLQHMDDDDGHYVTVTSTAIQQNAIYQFEQSMGFTTLPFTGLIINSIELLYAFFAKLFVIEPAVFVHTVMPVVLVPLSYTAFYCMVRKTPSLKRRVLFLGFVSLLNVFGNFSAYSSSSFLFLRIWQGKAIMVNILIPFLYSVFFSYHPKIPEMKEKVINHSNADFNKIFILFALTLLAGICAASVALFLMPIAIISLLVPYIIMTKEYKFLKYLFLSLIVIVPYVAISVITIQGQPIQATEQANTNFSLISIFQCYFGSGCYAAIYLIGMIYAYIKGEWDQKLLFHASAFIILIFLNPLLGVLINIIPNNWPLAGMLFYILPVYWRFFWLIPGIYLSAWMAADIIVSIQGRNKTIVGMLMVLCITVSGSFVFTSSNYSFVENMYKLPDSVINISETIRSDKQDEQVVLLLPLELSAKIRQYDTDNLVLISRLEYTQISRESAGQNNEYMNIVALYNTLYNNSNELSVEQVGLLINEFNIAYIILPGNSTNGQLLLDAGLSPFRQVDGYVIYRETKAGNDVDNKT